MAHVEHGHCKDCGTCYIGGFTKTNHTCTINARVGMRSDIREVMEADMQGTAAKTRQMHRAAFYRELEKYGFQIERA